MEKILLGYLVRYGGRGIDQNERLEWSGTDGRNQSESVSGMAREYGLIY